MSIVQNGNRQPVNYVLPPGIVREIDPTTQTLVQLNEESLSLDVCNLKDGDSRAAYKTMQLDFRRYGVIQMYIHAEGASTDLNQLKPGDINAFVRIGSDLTENYYKYEIPLTSTDAGETDPYKIWPVINELDINSTS